MYQQLCQHHNPRCKKISKTSQSWIQIATASIDITHTSLYPFLCNLPTSLFEGTPWSSKKTRGGKKNYQTLHKTIIIIIIIIIITYQVYICLLYISSKSKPQAPVATAETNFSLKESLFLLDPTWQTNRQLLLLPLLLLHSSPSPHPCLPKKSKLFMPTRSAHSSRRTGRKLFCCFPPVPLLPTQRKRGTKKRGGVFRHPPQINLKTPKKKKKKNPKSAQCAWWSTW